MNRIAKAIVGVALGLMPFMSWGGELGAVLDRVPSLQALRASHSARLAATRGENVPKGPEAEGGYMWGADGTNKWSVGVSQEFEWPAVYGARRQYNAALARTLDLEYRMQRFETADAMAAILVEKEYCKRRIALMEQMLKDLEHMEQVLAAAVEERSVTVLDRRKAALEVAAMRLDLSEARGALALLDTRLAQVTGLPVDQVEGLSVPPMPLGSLEDCRTAALECDPAYALALQEGDMASLENDVARAATMPSLSLGYRHDKEAEGHFNGFAVGVALPQWSAAASRAAARERTRAATVAAQAVHDRLLAQTDAQYARALVLRDRALTRSTAQLGSDYMAILIQAYQSRVLSVLDFLTESRYYYEAMLKQVDAEQEYALALWQLNRYALAGE